MSVLFNRLELYDYLVRVKGQVDAVEAPELMEAIALAIGNVTCISTEFVGEARNALRQVLNSKTATLTDAQREEMVAVFQELSSSLRADP